MMQERNVIQRPKVQERDVDRSPRSAGIGRDSSVTTDVASGLALVLSILAFFFSSVAVIQGVQARREVQAVLNPPSPQASPGQNGAGSFAALDKRVVTPPVINQVEPGLFVRPAYGGAGKVELLSVQRADGSGVSNVVKIVMRVTRLSDRVQGVGDLDLAEVVAINSRTNERYPTLDFQSPFGNDISLYNLRPNQSVEVNLTVRVPEDLNRIDLSVPQTNLFRGVPIVSPGNAASSR